MGSGFLVTVALLKDSKLQENMKFCVNMLKGFVVLKDF